ncbi:MULTISPECIES: vWA domain-containing protein [Myxococcus]|uniref:Aerotolerance regulator BatA n=1 Tax=Myxococcus xanthus TaxID=34 RepID=A0AAE6G4P7_MYXXA|nr:MULTISPECIES: VWA domain-containing protein [Myxococcus]QDE70559.1 aerotolerance regulator BatA [Myxococcus xanthus]QDE77839.1 aerotolerance regulator BatA [Myxococcus xanthus]QDE85222.1 aerotolerance regulator BatA [Myxococcus xanthus]QDE99383.1 aerotolerance regulator BatA [Myxococcus xanthus]QDF07089.1 aerotolerance regulator BatA [Myxococcus xanthus]
MPPLPAFNNPEALWGLLLVPLLLWQAWRERRARATLRFSAAHVFARGGRGFRTYLLPLLPLLRVAAVTAAVLAIARPQVRDSRVRDLSVEGIDIVVALDLSTSMEAGDFRPQNRMHVAKEVLSEFIANRVNDRIGLVVFAGAAYTQAPLTLDYGVLKEVVKQLRTRVLEDGTAIGDALATSLNRLRDSEAKSRVVVLITDGDNNSGKISPMDSANMAQALKVPIYTILVGKGGKVPFPQGTDLFGNTVWRDTEIPINPELMQDIADRTGGEYYRATDPEQLREGLQKVLDSLERSKLMEGGASATYREEFHPFLLAAFGLAALELLLRASFLRVFP